MSGRHEQQYVYRSSLLWQTTDSYQRFGNAITSRGTLNLRHASYANDFSPIAGDCLCTCCRSTADGGLGISRAFIHHVAAKETAGAHLLTMHNVHYLLNLMDRIRQALLEDRYPAFIKEFFGKLYDKKDFPKWAIDALRGVGVDLLE